MAVICVCAPRVKPFFARYLPGLLSSHFRSDNRGHEPSKITDPKAPPTIGSHTYGQNGPDRDVDEMQRRDDVSPDTSTTKCGGNDDEARLWNGKTCHKVPFSRNAPSYRARIAGGPLWRPTYDLVPFLQLLLRQVTPRMTMYRIASRLRQRPMSPTEFHERNVCVPARVSALEIMHRHSDY